MNHPVDRSRKAATASTWVKLTSATKASKTLPSLAAGCRTRWLTRQWFGIPTSIRKVSPNNGNTPSALARPVVKRLHRTAKMARTSPPLRLNRSRWSSSIFSSIWLNSFMTTRTRRIRLDRAQLLRHKSAGLAGIS